MRKLIEKTIYLCTLKVIVNRQKQKRLFDLFKILSNVLCLRLVFKSYTISMSCIQLFSLLNSYKLTRNCKTYKNKILK